ncbi:hypothetical protein [Novacetimonas hansenii]|uniref:hypothetical protein n=1 Tax=Novacetimonas hansenii TaxID=436 RepID=UPI0011153A4D|nr:hypothetical protein [Novacetimonas hansenii]
MAIQKSKVETFQVSGSRQDWLSKCEKALHNAGFKSVLVNSELSLLSAKISTLTLSGSIKIFISESDSGFINLRAESSANIDNIYALFRSPNNKILEMFSKNIQ